MEPTKLLSCRKNKSKTNTKAATALLERSLMEFDKVSGDSDSI